MNPEVERLFHEVLQLPEAEWEAFLDQHCPDAIIRGDVESLLIYERGAETFFANAVGGEAAAIHRNQEPAPGERIGAYRIISLLGRGGMGSVYLAERADGAFEQQVAIKVVQWAIGVGLERFQLERQILARLNHLNIARIFDGGQTPGGLPYFAMEYVAGQTIDQFCDRNNLNLKERLGLFLKACDAVQHAHEHLVVHRDLKPANILVSKEGEPKLLDFGIAKMIDMAQQASASTQLLTPEYASPEQIRGDPVTTASDVYSLGAVLYKLLTGRPPHLTSTMAPADAVHAVSEREAPAAGIAADVDAILAKALHKDGTRRYRSAEELAKDIRRYLGGYAVQAAPDSSVYLLRRFVGRNKLVTAVSALAVLFLVVGSAFSLMQARHAERRFQQVRQLANVFLFDFEKSIENLPGSLEARKLVVTTSRHYLEQLSVEAGGDAGLQREIAEAYEKLGAIQHSLQSAGQDANESRLRAYEIRRKLGDGGSSNPIYRKHFIELTTALASGYSQSKNSTEGMKWGQEATTLATRWADAEPGSLDAIETARAVFRNSGQQLELAGQAGGSRLAFEQAIQFGERASKIGSSDHHTDYDLAVVEYIYSNMLLNLKEKELALKYAESALSRMEELHKLNPANQKWRRTHQMALSSVGIAHRALADKDPAQVRIAIDFLRRAHDAARSIAQDDPKNALSKDDFIAQCHRLARALRQQGDYDQAAPMYIEAGQASRELIVLNPRNRRHYYLFAKNQLDHADLVFEQKRYEPARQLLLSANESFERGLMLDPNDATILEVRAAQYHLLTQLAEKRGDAADARLNAEHCLEVIRGMATRDASAKSYIGDYDAMVTTIRRVGLSMKGLPAN